MSQKQKEYGTDEEDAGIGFKIPKLDSVMGGIDDLRANMRQEHQELMEEEEKSGKAKKRQKPKGGTICFCGSPSCGIGPFVERSGGE